LMHCSGALAYTWLLCLMYVAVLLAQQHMVWSSWWYSYSHVHRFY
jgi:hypothetical protein